MRNGSRAFLAEGVRYNPFPETPMTKDLRAPFAGRKYLSLESLRKNGQAVRTPVWFAEAGGVFYVYSVADSGKVKRIRNNPRIRVAPCGARGNVRGEWVPATARLLEGQQAKHANDLLNAKYGIQKRILDFFAKLRPRKRAYLAITLDPSV
jgi:PPOX class probable F420-dependent enzyme